VRREEGVLFNDFAADGALGRRLDFGFCPGGYAVGLVSYRVSAYEEAYLLFLKHFG